MSMMYQKEEVLPYMKGLWREALQSICALPSTVFNGKHQPCPNCGGNDRFRWTDNLETKGDGGAICNVCGNDKGIGWIMKLTGEPYSEAVNILGRFLGKVPQEYRVKAYKRIARTTDANIGKQVDHESCMAVMHRTELRTSTPLSVYECLLDESFTVGVKPREDGGETLIHAYPCYLAQPDGLDDEMCNILFVNEEGESSFMARDHSRGSVVKLGAGTGSIYLVCDIIEGHRVATATNQEVWVTFTPENLEIVAWRYKGDRELRVACLSTDYQTLCMADDRDLKVILPNNDNFRQGMQRRLYDPQSLIDRLE